MSFDVEHGGSMNMECGGSTPLFLRSPRRPLIHNMECGGSTPLFSGQPRLPDISEPRLAEQSGAEAPHSKYAPTQEAEA